VITHNAMIGEMADRIVTMKDGRISADKRVESKVPVEQLRW
jgi:putative ABC transport system ATP-binding protein